MKYIPNSLTVLRIVGSAALLLCRPFSAPFLLLYTLCGLTDIADGYIARKTGNTSRAGAVLDSVADMIFIAVMLFVFLSAVPLAPWILGWIFAVALIRIGSLGVGFVRYRAFAGLHTYANKATGLLLFGFPYLYRLCGINGTAGFLLVTATLSGLEEMAIHLTSRTLNRDVKSLFFK